MIKGTLTAIVTPFAAGALDEEALREHIEFQLEGGVDGIVPCGTTGESPTLSIDEHLRVVEIAVRQVAGRVPVVAGTGSNNTGEALHLTREAKRLGADACLMITPYYNKPTQEGLYRHFLRIAEEVGLPMVLYNIPGRTGVRLQPETVARLAAHPAVTGIKDAVGDPVQSARLLGMVGSDFSLLSGDDAMTLPLMALGGVGVISTTSNVAPRRMSDMVKAFLSGDLEGARELHYRLLPLFDALFQETNPIPVKSALAMMGRIGEEIRLPMTPLSQGCRPPLEKAMRSLGIELPRADR